MGRPAERRGEEQKREQQCQSCTNDETTNRKRGTHSSVDLIDGSFGNGQSNGLAGKKGNGHKGDVESAELHRETGGLILRS